MGLVELNLDLAKHFAWLLRLDLRKGKLSSDQPDDNFLQWWLIQGRAEYPYWSYISEREFHYLFEPVGKLHIGSEICDIPRAMQLVLSRRPDVVQKFSVDKKINPNAVAAWFWLMGLKEHLMVGGLTLDTVRALDKSVVMVNGIESKTLPEAPLPTVLMSLAWSLIGSEMQKGMSLENSDSRYRFMTWFFVVAQSMFKFDALIANRWRSWLLQDIPVMPTKLSSEELPRFAVMEHSLLDPSKSPDISTQRGFDELRAWAKSAIEPRGKWSWLYQKMRYKSDGLPDLEEINRWRPPQTSLGSLVKDSPEALRRPFGVNLIGFALGELGLGEDLRMAVACCQAANIPYRVMNIPLGKEIRQNDLLLLEELKESGKPVYPVNIFCMPGFDVIGRIFLPKGAGSFKNYYNIGWWPWEMSVWPKAWSRAFELVDELWTCSSFSQEMYAKSTTKLCTLMPLSASTERVKTYSREHFGLPAKKYLFLYVFDFSSHLMRKNPLALLSAFEENFAGNHNVGLVLKIMNSNPEDETWKQFKKRVEGDRRIYLIEETLDRPEILGLIKACDVYVSPHRAEGFGRTLAEAMLLGKAVVATNYSGNQFFMNPNLTFPVDYELIPAKAGDYHFIENDDEAVWANISVKHLGEQMKAALVVCRESKFKKNVQVFAQSFFTPKKTGMLMNERLEKVRLELLERGWI